MAFSYVQTPERLVDFLKKIGTVGIPGKVNIDYLKTLGYTSSNDRAFVSVLKAIGFIDGSGNPSDLWKEARVNLGAALGKGVLRGYAGLYQTYPNAHQQGNEAIKNYFKANSDLGEVGVSRIVSTYRALANAADFSTSTDAPEERSDAVLPKIEPAESMVTKVVTGSNGITLNLNIELQVPADSTGEVYERFFAAMKKHLIDANA